MKFTQNVDYSEFQKANPLMLADLERLAHRQREAEAAVEFAESKLRLAKAELALIQENQLPALMDQLGLSKFVTKSGLTITVSDQIYAKEAISPAASEWLEKHGQSGAIRRQLVVQFDKDQDELAAKFEQDCANDELRYKRNETVHHKTLTSILKELMSEGIDVPLDLFSAYQKKVAKIKQKDKQ